MNLKNPYPKEWATIRKRIIERDQWCQRCGSREHLTVSHIYRYEPDSDPAGSGCSAAPATWSTTARTTRGAVATGGGRTLFSFGCCRSPLAPPLAKRGPGLAGELPRFIGYYHANTGYFVTFLLRLSHPGIFTRYCV